MKTFFTTFLVLFISINTIAQHKQFRIALDFSIKEKRSDGSFALQMGRAYYDLNHKKLVYDVSFPNKQMVLTNDSSIYLIENGKAIDMKKDAGFIQMSIFHLCLTGSINSFGLDESVFEAKKVEKENNLVMTTWEIPKKIRSRSKTKVITSIKDRKLYGVVFLDADEKVISKQFYKNYQTINGVEVPTKVIFILMVNDEEQYRIMEFKNIEINEFGNESIYNYPTPTFSTAE
ncbi:MAG: hypothetical protein ACPGLV_11760 [Bacteroidia bacterium]